MFNCGRGKLKESITETYMESVYCDFNSNKSYIHVVIAVTTTLALVLFIVANNNVIGWLL